MYPLYICYFTFGFCMTFGSIAMNFEMMESLQFTPVEMTMSYGVIAAPWCIRPVFGLVSDTFQIIDWGKRRPYIFCCENKILIDKNQSVVEYGFFFEYA